MEDSANGRGVEDSAIGRQLRARRTAAGRTVASVAADAGRELAEADWWRLLDALLLIAAHPSGS